MVTHGEDLGGRVIGKMRQMFCGLHGHDSLLQFGRDRMYLRCVSCGYETPGWALNDTPPPAAIPQETRPQPLMQPQLVSARRVA